MKTVDNMANDREKKMRRFNFFGYITAGICGKKAVFPFYNGRIDGQSVILISCPLYVLAEMKYND